MYAMMDTHHCTYVDGFSLILAFRKSQEWRRSWNGNNHFLTLEILIVQQNLMKAIGSFANFESCQSKLHFMAIVSGTLLCNI